MKVVIPGAFCARGICFLVASGVGLGPFCVALQAESRFLRLRRRNHTGFGSSDVSLFSLWLGVSVVKESLGTE